MTDVIYRKEALETISNFGNRKYRREHGTLNDAYKLISCLPSAQQWIPCSERLPEEDGDYLVCYEEGYRKDYGFPKIGIAPYEVDAENFGVWTEQFDLFSMGSLGTEFVEIGVDAWMPLPEPYEGKTYE